MPTEREWASIHATCDRIAQRMGGRFVEREDNPMTDTPEAVATMDKTPEQIAAPLDCTGRPIMVGDVLKVFHFVGARRKRHFMFKQVVGVRTWPSGFTAFLVSHLNMKDPAGPDGGYYLGHDGKRLADTEIVQGIDWHHDRPRAILQQESTNED